MRTAVLLAIAFMACAVRPAVSEMTTIAEGSYAREQSSREALLVASAADFERVWAERIGREPMPSPDFSKGVAVLLFAGTRNTGGWSVVPESVEVDGTTAIVHATIQGPRGGGIVTQALTSPYAVVFLTNRDVKTVQWPQ